VVVLTTYEDDRSVLDALRAGARGYLSTTCWRRPARGTAPRRSATRTGTAWSRPRP